MRNMFLKKFPKNANLCGISRVSLILLLVLILGWVNLSWADGDEILNTSYQTYGHFGMVSEGVGLRDFPAGDIVLDVPGTVAQAWLYWGGYDRIPGGDDSALLAVDGGADQAVTGALINDPNNCWWWGPFYGFVYRADVTEWIESGGHTYTVSGILYAGSAAVLQGASILVVYEDPTLPLQEIEIKDGYDGLWNAYEPPRGPHSGVVTFLFDTQPVSRNLEFTFLLGGVDNYGADGIRTNALWYGFGYGSDTPPTELVDQPGAVDYMGSSTDPPLSFDINPAYDEDGKEWDNTTITISVPANATFMSVQIESEDSYQVGEQKYRAASMLFFGSAQVMAGRGRIGDFVWKDMNGDGIQDTGELGLDGVTLCLLSEAGDTVATAVTGDNSETVETENGWYSFTDLEAGTYNVWVDTTTIPVDYTLTGGTQPHTVVLDVGEDYAQADFGYQPALFDFGDADDVPYPSRKANDGARHGMGPFYFGEGVSYEEDSNQPNLDQNDDGIVLLGSSASPGGPYELPMDPGEYAAAQVTLAGTYEDTVYVHGWIDWNQDGDWEDADENVFCSVPFMVPVVDTIEFMVPAQVDPASLWGRFRVDDEQLNEPTGEARYGEVEDYFWQDALLAVELNSFNAIAGVGQVTLEWITQSETENLGFNVYRAEASSGVFKKVNDDIISGQGTTETSTLYVYVDHKVQQEKEYYYKISDVNFKGFETMHGPVSVSVIAAPEEYRLEQNYPNPFNPQTIIRYSLKSKGNVRLEIYNLVGQKIRTLANKTQGAGTYEIQWDGRNETGELMPSGVYICKMKAGQVERSMRMTFMQ